MRKYLEIAKLHMKSQLVWRADVAFNMIFTISKILFAYLLWSMIFAEKGTVMGLTFSGMMSYYIVSSFLSQLDMSDRVSVEMNQRIRQGSFSKYMVIPCHIEGYFLAMIAGLVAFYVAFDFIAGVVWIVLFQIEFQFTTNILVLLCAICMIVIGMIFMVQLNYYLGLLTLKYEGIGTFLMIKNNLMALITGTIVPLAIFPDIVLRVMKLLPFYYITYLPSMLLTGNFENEAVRGIFVLAIWCFLLQVLIQFTWSHYVRKYEGVGI